MSLPLDDSRFWQDRADEARQMANVIDDFASKSVLIRIAIDFDRLAARASVLKNRLQVGIKNRSSEHAPLPESSGS